MSRTTPIAEKLRTVITFLVLPILIQCQHTENNTTYPSTSTQVPLVDVELAAFFFGITTILEFAHLLVALWVIVVITTSGALKKNTFLYHVLSLAIADVVFAASGIITVSELILAPRGLGGLSSPLFSSVAFDVATAFTFASTTQHYLVLAVITSERIYAVARPFDYDARGPPFIPTAILSVFFAANIAVSLYGCMLEISYSSATQYNGFFLVVAMGNKFLAITLIASTVILYAALIVVVRRQAAKVNASEFGVAETPAQHRSIQITKAVLKVGVVYVGTAFVASVVSIIIDELSSNGQMTLGPYFVVDAFFYIPLCVGDILDLLILVLKIDELIAPSVKYLKTIRCNRAAVRRGNGVLVTNEVIAGLANRHLELLHHQ